MKNSERRCLRSTGRSPRVPKLSRARSAALGRVPRAGGSQATETINSTIFFSHYSPKVPATVNLYGRLIFLNLSVSGSTSLWSWQISQQTGSVCLATPRSWSSSRDCSLPPFFFLSTLLHMFYQLCDYFWYALNMINQFFLPTALLFTPRAALICFNSLFPMKAWPPDILYTPSVWTSSSDDSPTSPVLSPLIVSLAAFFVLLTCSSHEVSPLFFLQDTSLSNVLCRGSLSPNSWLSSQTSSKCKLLRPTRLLLERISSSLSQKSVASLLLSSLNN